MTIVQIVVDSGSDEEASFEGNGPGLINGRAVEILRQEVATRNQQLPEKLQEAYDKVIRTVGPGCETDGNRTLSPLLWCHRTEDDLRYRLRNYAIWIPTMLVVIGCSIVGTVIASRRNIGDGIAGMVVLCIASPFIGDFLTHMEENFCVWVLQRSVKQEHEETIQKIQALINKLEVFPEKSFAAFTLGNALPETPFMSSTKENLLREMNIKQLLELKKQLGEDSFKELVNGVLLPLQKDCLEVIQNPQVYTLGMLSVIVQLKDLLQSDPSAWKEIVKAANKAQCLDDQIERELNACRPSSIKRSVQEMIERSSDHQDMQVSIHVKVNQRPYSLVTLNSKHLLHYDFFARKLKYEADENEGLIEIDIEMTEEEALVFPFLIHFILGRKDPIMEKNMVPLLQLADKFGCDDCVLECYNLLMINRNRFEPCSLFEILLSHVNISIVREKNDELLLEEIGKAIKKHDLQQAASLIELGSHFNLKEKLNRLGGQLTEQKVDLFDKELLNLIYRYDLERLHDYVSDKLQDRLSTRPTDLQELYFTTGIPSLYDLAERYYISHMTAELVKPLWEFAECDDHPDLKLACRQFFADCEDQATISRQWGLGKFPVELLGQQS